MTELFYALVRFITVKVIGYSDNETLSLSDGLRWINTYHQIAQDLGLIVATVIAVSIVIVAYVITIKIINKKYSLSK